MSILLTGFIFPETCILTILSHQLKKPKPENCLCQHDRVSNLKGWEGRGERGEVLEIRRAKDEGNIQRDLAAFNGTDRAGLEKVLYGQ